MKKKHTSELYASLNSSKVETNSQDFEAISLRMPHRSAAMIQALSIGFQQPVLSLLTDGISLHLAESLLTSASNGALVIEESRNGIQPDSALDHLLDVGAFEDRDTVLLEEFRRNFPGPRK